MVCGGAVVKASDSQRDRVLFMSDFGPVISFQVVQVHRLVYTNIDTSLYT